MIVGPAKEQAQWLLRRLVEERLIERPADHDALIEQAMAECLPRFDAINREVAWQSINSFEDRLRVELLRQFIAAYLKTVRFTENNASADVAIVSWLTGRVSLESQLLLARQPNLNTVDIVLKQLEQAIASEEFPWQHDRRAMQPASEKQLLTWTRQLQQHYRSQWQQMTTSLNALLERRAALTWNHLVCEAIIVRVPITDDSLRSRMEQCFALRYRQGKDTLAHHGDEHLALPGTSELPVIDPHAGFDRVMQAATNAHGRASLAVGPHHRFANRPGW